MKPHEIQFSLNLEALSAPQCRRIIEALIDQPMSLTELSKTCKLTPASINKHLEILKTSGLVKVREIDGDQVAQLQKSKFKPTLDWFSKLLS
jgi:DNA-binding transcriptional ArsR family regulator